MSDVKEETQSAGPVKSQNSEREIQREDLRLDCLRLAAQRQGARDSRGLLEIAEEYFHWVTAESVGHCAGDNAPSIAPEAIDWSTAKAAPVRSAARLSLGKRTAAVKVKGKKSTARARNLSGV